MSIGVSTGPSPARVLLTVGQVAVMLNIHVNTVRRWSAQGLLASYRVGPRRDRRFERAEVERLLTSQAEAVPSATQHEGRDAAAAR